MQVLAINQFFWPDTAATGELLADVARQIDPDIHTVTVLCTRVRACVSGARMAWGRFGRLASPHFASARRAHT